MICDTLANYHRYMDELKVYFGLLQSAGTRHDRRLVGRLANRVGGLRQKITKDLLSECLKAYPSGCAELNQLFNVPSNTTCCSNTEQAFVCLLAVKYLQDQKTLTLEVSKTVIDRISGFNERELDPLLARLLQTHIKTAARLNRPADIHTDLMHWLRASTLRHDHETVSVAHNGLARVYLLTGQWEMMDRLFANCPFPLESSSHNQAARHHYYAARLAAVKLQYDVGYVAVEQALRKAPHHAVAFRAVCHRLLIVIRLLLGDIPELAMLKGDQNSNGNTKAHYYQLCKAVRSGDVSAFQALLRPDSPTLLTFQRDNLEGLILRLHQNVLKAGLKRIAVAYSAISINDIQRKLALETPQDALMIVMKAVQTGVINGRIHPDPSSGQHIFLTIPESKTDAEKSAQLHHRITQCQSMIQETVKAMRFPDRKPTADRSTMEQVEEQPQDLEDLDDVIMMDEDFF